MQPEEAQLADSLGLPHDAVSSVLSLLKRKKQLMIAGPPGAGKTYFAERLAAHLCSDVLHSDGERRWRIIQFHPAYSYEDFVSGLRPQEPQDGRPSFAVQPGHLLQMILRAKKALDDGLDDKFCLVIDEFNRANLSTVLGELYTLLGGSRDDAQEVSLRDAAAFGACGQRDLAEPLSLPSNLYLICTMNTADRSIASLDAALQRRFAYVLMAPSLEGESKPPQLLLPYARANSVLQKQCRLSAQLLNKLCKTLDKINQTLSDESFEPGEFVGPSYFLGCCTSRDVARAWKLSVKPYLEDVMQRPYVLLHCAEDEKKLRGIEQRWKAIFGSGSGSGNSGTEPTKPPVVKQTVSRQPSRPGGSGSGGGGGGGGAVTQAAAGKAAAGGSQSMKAAPPMKAAAGKATDWKDRAVVLAAVKQNGNALSKASEELRGDREVVLAAVKQNGNALSIASEELRGDREVVLAAVKQNASSPSGNALSKASEELRGDREIVLAAVKQNGYALQYASEEGLGHNYQAVVQAAVEQNSNALQFAREGLRGDRDFVLAAVKQDGRALLYASEGLRGDRDFVLAAVKQNGKTANFLDVHIVESLLMEPGYVPTKWNGQHFYEHKFLHLAILRDQYVRELCKRVGISTHSVSRAQLIGKIRAKIQEVALESRKRNRSSSSGSSGRLSNEPQPQVSRHNDASHEDSEG